MRTPDTFSNSGGDNDLILCKQKWKKELSIMLQSINKIHLFMVEMDRNHSPNVNCNIFSGVINHRYLFSFD